MDFLPDILDHLGKTPREFGALHVHFESVTTVEGMQVVARVLFQAAFSPLSEGAQVAFHAASAEGAKGEQLGCYDLPMLAERAVRVAYPLVVPEGATHVVAFINAPAPGKRAERVRPAWKLTDTIEIPKLSEMNPVHDDQVEFDVVGSLVNSALSGGLSIEFSVTTTSLAANTRASVHKARELPPGMVQVISSEVSAPLVAVTEETLWRLGQPLPAPPEILYARPQLKWSGVRRCPACYFEGPSDEYERARSCPNCDAPWL